MKQLFHVYQSSQVLKRPTIRSRIEATSERSTVHSCSFFSCSVAVSVLSIIPAPAVSASSEALSRLPMTLVTSSVSRRMSPAFSWSPRECSFSRGNHSDQGHERNRCNRTEDQGTETVENNSAVQKALPDFKTSVRRHPGRLPQLP